MVALRAVVWLCALWCGTVDGFLPGRSGAPIRRARDGIAWVVKSPIDVFEAFEASAACSEVIDARSPSEYEEDHFPGAINLPVLSDEERHEVGRDPCSIASDSNRTKSSWSATLLIEALLHHIIHVIAPLFGSQGACTPLTRSPRGSTARAWWPQTSRGT